MTFKIQISSEQLNQICDIETSDYYFKPNVFLWCRERDYHFWIDVRLSDDIRIFVEYFIISEDDEALMEFKLVWL